MEQREICHTDPDEGRNNSGSSRDPSVLGNGGWRGRADQRNQNPWVDREWLVTNHSPVKAMIQLPDLLLNELLKPLSTRRGFKIALQSTHAFSF